jgi:hypothetical protein
LFLDIVWSFMRCSRCKTREAEAGVLASKIGCGTKIVADEMINKPSPDYDRIVSKDSELAWRSR